MARPKGKLMALIAVFAAIGLVTATGAFTSVSATRTANVDVAGDNAALVGLSANSSHGVTGVVSKSNGEISLSFNDGSGSASGININGVTNFNSILDITNNGADGVSLTVSLSDNSGDEPSGDSSVETPSSFVTVKVEAVNGDGSASAVGKDLVSNSVTFNSGDTITISIKFDTTGGSNLKGDDILDTITFDAS